MSDDGVQLFSYGTLQDPVVQLATFGRELQGHADVLVGYAVRWLDITDAAVVATSGEARHPIVVATNDPTDGVPGQVLVLTAAELAAADEYEVDDYTRVLAPLRSGTTAWVYVSAAPSGRPSS
ncbi:MAG: hypothetical protein QOG69_2895 [Actinomycetota bacterium]|nr:hypothetical protein [Actinomycetota bacterium]